MDYFSITAKNCNTYSWIDSSSWSETERAEISSIITRMIQKYSTRFRDIDRYMLFRYTDEPAHVSVSAEENRTVFFIKLSSTCLGIPQLIFELGQEIGHVLAFASEQERSNLWIEEVATWILSIHMLGVMKKEATLGGEISVIVNNDYEMFEEYKSEQIQMHQWNSEKTTKEFVDQNITILEDFENRNHLLFGTLAYELYDKINHSSFFYCMNYMNKITSNTKISTESYFENWINSCPDELKAEVQNFKNLLI